MIELSNEEKLMIIYQHLRNAQVNEYNAEVGLMLENAKDNPDLINIDQLQKQINNEKNKQYILKNEIDKLSIASEKNINNWGNNAE